MNRAEEEQIMALRDMVRHTGVLYELQVKNLTAWGKLVLPHAVVDVRVDTDDCLVEYSMRTKTEKQPTKFKRRLTILDKSVKWLLGAEWKVTVLDGKKQIFASQRLAQWKNKRKKTEEALA